MKQTVYCVFDAGLKQAGILVARKPENQLIKLNESVYKAHLLCVMFI